jgi:lysophospholipase L1-like esterase
MRRFFLKWFAVFALLLPLLSATALPALCKDNYVALGDSIAAGYLSTGYSDDLTIPNKGFVYLFDEFLNQQGHKTKLANLAQNGMPSSGLNMLSALLNPELPPRFGLLDQLRNDDAVRKAVRKAEILTISIGGNNVLPAALAWLNPQQGPAVATAMAQAGITAFQNDWPAILEEIRALTDAPLYVITLYNPYEVFGYPSLPFYNPAFYAFTEASVTRINAVINDEQLRSDYGYKVADVYSAFRGKTPVLTQISTLSPPTGDPFNDLLNAVGAVHPTDAGHAVIAQSIVAIYP